MDDIGQLVEQAKLLGYETPVDIQKYVQQAQDRALRQLELAAAKEERDAVRAKEEREAAREEREAAKEAAEKEREARLLELEEKEKEREEKEKEREAAKLERENQLRLAEMEVEKEKEKSAREKQEQEARLLQEREKREHELEVLRLQRQSAADSTTPAAGVTRQGSSLPKLKLPIYKEGETLEPWIKRFEDWAGLCQFDEPTKAIHFKALFEGKPLDILHRLDPAHSSFDDMKKALEDAYGLSVEQLRGQFFGSKLQEKETAGQFMARVAGAFEKWVLKDGTPQTFEGICDLMKRSQFERSCPPELLAQVKIHKVKTCEDLVAKAEAHFAAYGRHPKKQGEGQKKNYKDGQKGNQTQQQGSQQPQQSGNQNKTGGKVFYSSSNNNHRSGKQNGQWSKSGSQHQHRGPKQDVAATAVQATQQRSANEYQADSETPQQQQVFTATQTSGASY